MGRVSKVQQNSACGRESRDRPGANQSSSRVFRSASGRPVTAARDSHDHRDERRTPPRLGQSNEPLFAVSAQRRRGKNNTERSRRAEKNRRAEPQQHACARRAHEKPSANRGKSAPGNCAFRYCLRAATPEQAPFQSLCSSYRCAELRRPRSCSGRPRPCQREPNQPTPTEPRS